MTYLVIDEHNAHEFASPNGHGRGYKGWQRPGTPHIFRGVKPNLPLIPRSEWSALIKAGQGNWLSDLLKKNNVRSKDQDGLNYCWCYGSALAAETKILLQGEAYKEYAPESVAVPCVNGANEGGYASQAFNQMHTGGMCHAELLPADHSDRIQDRRGNVIKIDSAKWSPGWQTDALKHLLVDWYEIDTSFDQVMTCLLNRIPVAAGLDWWRHLVCFLDPVEVSPGKFGVLIQNSWGVDWPTEGANGYSVLTEAKATPDGAACPLFVATDNPVVPPTPVDPAPQPPAPLPVPTPVPMIDWIVLFNLLVQLLQQWLSPKTAQEMADNFIAKVKEECERG